MSFDAKYPFLMDFILYMLVIWNEMCSFNQMESTEEYEILDEEWKGLEESILSNVVLSHNQLFGSGDLVQAVSLCSVAFFTASKLEYDLLFGVEGF